MKTSYKSIIVIAVAAAVVALPFIFKREADAGDWRSGDPVLVVISPHIAAIRSEFERGFSEWHGRKYGKPVKIDWRNIGGTTEIMRYIEAEYAAAFRAYWTQSGHELPEGGINVVFDRKFKADVPPEGAEPGSDEHRKWQVKNEAWKTLRERDSPDDFGCKIDVFFGGGTYDHSVAADKGLTVPAWRRGEEPAGIFYDEKGNELYPLERGGEVWRTDSYCSAALSAFGICHNPDRLRDLGIANAPVRWTDLADARYFGQVGVTDPTKSGSIAKAFELIIHTECLAAVKAAGYSIEQAREYEKVIAAARLPAGQMPEGVPQEYQKAIEKGWLNGINLVRMIGANARYFTDSASKPPMDVSVGDAAAGISIDFYSRVQSETTKAADGTLRLVYVTPIGGSSVSGDPISVLRGADHREIAEHFMEFVLGEEGQKLWNYRPGTEGGPERFSLRRMPVRRDFYPSDDPEMMARAKAHSVCTSDDLLDEAVDVYNLSDKFVYFPRWTAPHFAFFRLLIRNMCMDAGEELKAAWAAIIAAGGPEACPGAMGILKSLPEDVTWASAPSLAYGDTLALSRRWTLFFRDSYARARAAARGGEAPGHSSN